jgi:hypothetical protein
VPRVSSFELPISVSHNHLLRVLPVVGCRSKTPTATLEQKDYNKIKPKEIQHTTISDYISITRWQLFNYISNSSLQDGNNSLLQVLRFAEEHKLVNGQFVILFL